MKIDQDIRAAIRSAEKAQNDTDTWEVRERNIKKSISDFLRDHPTKAKRCRQLAKTIQRTATILEMARNELCKQYGLREATEKGRQTFVFANCDSDRKAFEKAGGKVIRKSEKWRYDFVMAELAAADSSQLVPILEKYGINWK